MANLLHRYHFPAFLKVDIHGIDRFVAAFDETFNHHLPNLHRHLKHLGVDSRLFLVEWWMTRSGAGEEGGRKRIWSESKGVGNIGRRLERRAGRGKKGSKGTEKGGRGLEGAVQRGGGRAEGRGGREEVLILALRGSRRSCGLQ
eukprot:759741-Hanusia_phi.AAC.5